jgi:hypothetical protein
LPVGFLVLLVNKSCNMISKNLKNNTSNKKVYDRLMDTFLNVQKTNDKLPALSDVEKISFEQDIAIKHLYYSSKIEGTNLGETRLAKAINAA